MERLVDRKLYTHCVRYGKIVFDKEYKVDSVYTRHTIFEMGKCKMLFTLINGNVIGYFTFDLDSKALLEDYL